MRKQTLLNAALAFSLLAAGQMTFAQAIPPKKPAPPKKPGQPAPQVPILPTNPLLQPAPGPTRPRLPMYLTVIPFPTLETSLQMTPDQSAKIKQIYQSLEGSSASTRTAAVTPEDKQKAAVKIHTLENDANKQISELLTEEQRKKSETLIFEMLKMASMAVSPQMLKELELTPDQRRQIMVLVDTVQAKMTALPAAERRGKYKELALPERAKIPALLTPKQLVIFNKYGEDGRPKSAAPAPSAHIDTPEKPEQPVSTPPPALPVPTPPPAADPIKN